MVNKVTVVGAGNVGATCAHEVARMDICKEVVIVDVKDGVSQGKGLDMWQTAPILGFNTRITGSTNDYSKTAGSDIVVITAGLPRKPGMSRDDLININAGIVKEVTENIMKYNENPIIIVVSNPLDVMTYAAFLASGLKSNRVMGMAGILDTARYCAFIADELGTSPELVKAQLMGGHGDTMVPLPRLTTVSGIPVTELIGKEKLDAIVERTKNGGGEIVSLMGTSAWYAPGLSAAIMVQAIAKDTKAILPVCASLNGEYGYKDLHLGVPVVLGKEGVEKVVELSLDAEEKALLDASALHVKKIMKVLDDMNMFSKKYGSDTL
ncbi:MAG: malate dehydrogenase [Rikenellaceae bacterium]|nr:malate dehydrogenase [Rikenellaceae bacterium]MDE7356305.1 malate dehydrogenase [Rikenellaceae bacterium]